jgi:hypothetical protein
VIKKLHIFIILFTISLGLFAQGGGRTYRVNAYGIQLDYVKGRSKIKASQLASNVIRVKNNTRKDMKLKLQISPPAGWKLFAEPIQEIELKAQDSVFIPVRVHPSVDLSGNTNYVVNAFISTESFTVTNAMWYIVVDKVSDWHAYTNSNKIYFRSDSDTANFQVIISNTGNSDEYLQVKIQPDKEIYVIDKEGNDVHEIVKSVLVAAGQDTSLRFSARIHRNELLPDGAQEVNANKQKKYRAKIRIVNEKSGKTDNKSWSGNIDFLQLTNTVKVKDTKRNAIPLTVEANFYDLLSDHTYASLYLYGNRHFKNQAFLNYYFQANFIQNEYDPTSFMGNYQYVGYFNKRFSVEVGDIGANRSGSMLSGKGAKASVNILNNNIGAMYVQRPKLWEAPSAWGYGFFHRLQTKKIFWDNYYQRFDNVLSKVKADLFTSYLNFRLSRNHTIRIGGGYSLENHYWIPNDEKHISGYSARLGYSGNFKKISLTLNAQYGTPNYTPLRGVLSVSPAIRYRLNKNYAMELSSNYFNFQPIIYSKGVVQRDDLYNIQTNYNFKLLYNTNRNLFIFQPTYYTIASNLVHANTGGMIFEYRLRSRGNFKFYTNAFMGYTGFPKRADLNQVFVSYIRASFRYKFLQANIRYYYGPYYQIEQMQYMINQINPQKLYANLYYDWWFLNNRMKLNLNLNYYLNTINSRHQLNTRPELFYYAKSGFRFSFYGRYILYGQGEYIRELPSVGGQPRQEVVEASVISQFEIGAGVKFNINVPIGLRGNCKVKVIAFRDMNGNGKKDINEQGINDMLIHITLNDTITNSHSNPNNAYQAQEVYDLVTNKKGEVEYVNVPQGDYVITARPLSSMGGWFDGKTFYRNIDHNKTIYIPLSKGARITGGILFERDRYGSNKPMDLNGIRITAMNDDNGKTYTTLTDKRGNFALYVPNGNYRIIMNEAAVGSSYEFLQNNIPIEVNKEFEDYNVSFYLVERQRKMRLSGGDISRLPIRRQQDKPKKTVSDKGQFTQIKDSTYLPVVVPKEEGKVWVVQLFNNEGPRHHKTDFDTLKNITSIRCIVGSKGAFLYISEGFTKKGDAKKLAKTIKKYGYNEAKIVPMVFGNKVVEKNTSSVKISTFDAKTEGDAYRVEIKGSAAKLDGAYFETLVPGIEQVFEVQFEGIYHYSIGKFDTQEEAKSRMDELRKQYPEVKMKITQYRLDQ